jgi:isocitrate dehydrogenase
MPNLYGDILSDVAAQIAGSVGLAGSANIGEHVAMFEAIHGSAPRRAGQNLANPSGLLHGAILMLVHIGQAEVAERVHNAWLKTIEDGVHTYDIFSEGISKEKVGTREFGAAVVARLGQEPSVLKPARYVNAPAQAGQGAASRPRAVKKMVGVDLFLDWAGGHPDELAKLVLPLGAAGLELKAISNRGTKVWPEGSPETFCTDHWCCRFLGQDGRGAVTHDQVATLLGRCAAAGLDFIKTEGLFTFDGERGYSAGGE